MKYPEINKEYIDTNLENEMKLVQKLVSLIHSIRKNNNIKIRQPLSKIMLFSNNNIDFTNKFKDIILSETNIKDFQILNDYTNFLTYNVKPNLKLLGEKYKNLIKEISSEISNLSTAKINEFRKNGNIILNCKVEINVNECIFELKPKDNILAGEYNNITVAIDGNITEELKEECIARDFINLIQNYRKTKSFNVKDKMEITLLSHDNSILKAINNNLKLICNTLLCTKLETTNNINNDFEKLTLNNSEIYIQIVQIN